MTPDILLVGVDGGATEVKAHDVLVERTDAGKVFQLGSGAASRKYERVDGFKPVPVATQIKQRDNDAIELTPQEQRQGEEWINSTCEAIVALTVASSSKRSLLIGIGMPGLKTPDKRGIAVINNGPRIPDFLDSLEARLVKAGLTLSEPIAVLGSDADYCGVGEEHAAAGRFRAVQNAYYLGAGTGLAEALKLHGQLVTFDAASNWIQKAWQIPSSFGPTFEQLVSAKGMNSVYNKLTARGMERGSGFPEIDAANNVPIAVAWMEAVAMLTAELVFERLSTIKNGRSHEPMRARAYSSLEPNHAYRGTVLDCVVLGQRYGAICHQPHGQCDLLAGIEKYLAAMIQNAPDEDLIRAYTPSGSLRPEFLRASNLRAAPALGAGIAAAKAAGI